MGIIFFGSKQTPIGYEELLVKCPCCETSTWAEVMVISKYYHIYWIPMFPFDKEADIICKECGLKRFGRSFDANLISDFDKVKSNFRHPWFTYSGVAVLTLLFLGVIAAAGIG